VCIWAKVKVSYYKSFVWFINVKDPESRLLRWIQLAEYDYETTFGHGSQNSKAGALSRIGNVTNMTDQMSLMSTEKNQILYKFHDTTVGGNKGWIKRTMWLITNILAKYEAWGWRIFKQLRAAGNQSANPWAKHSDGDNGRTPFWQVLPRYCGQQDVETVFRALWRK
jgi:hypothetical protein